jgi:hypothetical protein
MTCPRGLVHNLPWVIAFLVVLVRSAFGIFS